MKKMLSLLLTAAMILAMLCCGAFAEAADVTGEWYGSLFGIVMTLTVNEDGTYTIGMDDEEPDEGTWKLDGESLIMDEGSEDETVFAYDGESLYAEMEGIEFLFTREPVEVFVPAAARTDASLEEFAGDWSCTLVSMMGIQVPPEMAEIEIALSIEGETATLTLGLFGEPETVELPVAFADGVATVTIPSEYEDGEDSEYAIQLLEDGTMSITSLLMEEGTVSEIVFYMSSAEAGE